MLTTTTDAIFFNQTLLAFTRNGQTLVQTAARVSLGTDPANHTAFDVALAKLGGTIVYVSNFASPAAQFTAWAKSGGPAAVTLTDEEQTLPAQLKTLQDRIAAIKTRFTTLALPVAPKPPYPFSTAKNTSPLVVKGIGKARRVGNGRYESGMIVAHRFWNKLQPLWTRNKAGASVGCISNFYYTISGESRRIRVYSSYVEIGCQTVRREQIEALAKAEGWVK